MHNVPESPVHSSVPLDEAAWNTYLRKNIRQEHERASSRTKVVKWVCVLILLGTALSSSKFFVSTNSSSAVAVRFAIVLGALAVLLQSLRTHQYLFTGVFGGLMILFNPLFPGFAFNGRWPVLLAALVPFAASLIWMRERTQEAQLFTSKGMA
jgi:hypothetical protein